MFDDIKRKFETDGFAVLESLYSESEVQAMKDEIQKVVERMPSQETRAVFSTTNAASAQNKDAYFLDSGDKISYFFEEGAVDKNGDLLVEPLLSMNKIGMALHELNPVFRKYTFAEKVKEAAFQLGLEEPVVVQSMYIFKNPCIGSEVVAHQDATYLYTEPVNLVGFWIAIDDATVENGCLWFARGSHKSGVHRRYIRNPKPDSDELLIYSSPPPYYQKSTFTPVPVSKGSCVLIHGQVVHYSEANKSKKSRHAYTFHVAESKNTVWSKENWIQPKDRPFLNLYRT